MQGDALGSEVTLGVKKKRQPGVSQLPRCRPREEVDDRRDQSRLSLSVGIPGLFEESHQHLAVGTLLFRACTLEMEHPLEGLTASAEHLSCALA